MFAFEINDRREFTSRLFIGTTFDEFLLSECVITTFATFTIDGSVQRDFFAAGDEDAPREGQHLLPWKRYRDHCRLLIRGKQPPLFFRIVLQVPSLPELQPEEGVSLYLNIQYRDNSIRCTTGSSIRSFTPGMTPPGESERYILRYLESQGISFDMR